jgi:hypothetical protein
VLVDGVDSIKSFLIWLRNVIAGASIFIDSFPRRLLFVTVRGNEPPRKHKGRTAR